jgi:molybdopterin-guanine dinucleotide biosynthesis protein A
LIEAVKTADVLVPTVTDRIDRGVLSQAGPQLKLIAQFGTGVDNIDLETARNRSIIVTNTPAPYAGCGCVVVHDIVAGAGPLGGIITGLTWASSEYVFVTAGDMPNVNLRYIEWMMRMLGRRDTIAVATREGSEHVEPFNSIFARRCAPLMEAALALGERSVGRFLRGCGSATFVAEETARLFSPDWSMFASINTREDVQRFLARAPACLT